VHQSRREALWATAGKAIRAGLSKPVGANFMKTHSLVTSLELQDLMISLLGFDLALVSSYMVTLLFFTFGMGMFTLCHCTLEICDLLFDFIGAHS
jgi:hypothetical protein